MLSSFSKIPFFVCRSICLTVVPKGKSQMSKYRYEVKQLPGEILTDEKKTYYKVIVLVLLSSYVLVWYSLYIFVYLLFDVKGNNVACKRQQKPAYHIFTCRFFISLLQCQQIMT